MPGRLTRTRTDSTDLTQYVPEEGLQLVALAEVAERHAERAKDVTRLLEAVELKLAEQRKFVLWWDSQPRNLGGRPAENPLPISNGLQTAGTHGVPDRVTIHRWRTKLKADAAYDKTLQGAQDRCVRVCEFAKGSTDQRGASGTGEEEWFTPQAYIELARTVLGVIDLDPATHPLAQARVDRWWQRVNALDRPPQGIVQEDAHEEAEVDPAPRALPAVRLPVVPAEAAAADAVRGVRRPALGPAADLSAAEGARMTPEAYTQAQTLCATAPALADAYREWLMLVVDDARKVAHLPSDYSETLALIKGAEAGVPDRDAVWHAVCAMWQAETGLDPLTGAPPPRPKSRPSGPTLAQDALL